MDRLRSRAARLQLLLRRARESAFVTGPRPVQPVLPRPGAREPRQTDHLEGHSDPGDVHPEGELLGLEADDALSDRGSGVRRQQRPVTAAPGEERDRQRPAAGYRSALVAEPVARLRADSPLHLPALLADAAGPPRPERSRLRLALPGGAPSTPPRPGPRRRRRRGPRGGGGAVGGGGLPAASPEGAE